MNDNIMQEVLERIVRIETKIDGYNNLREKVDDTYLMASKNTDSIKKMEDNQKWLWRIIVGALITGFIATYVKFS